MKNIIIWSGYITLLIISGLIGAWCGYFYGMFDWHQWFFLYLWFYTWWCIAQGYWTMKGGEIDE